ncbi:hypothetical protein tb265_43420 [Gemmatimonadetes bacterium T265]|nr:hypothetical protein tb265_43420 [Gemmatimonadetes bacterium T265]
MGVGTVRAADLDEFVAECDRRGGLGTAATEEYFAGFTYVPATRVDRSLDPFSDAYFDQQAALYREIAGREINQEEGERTLLDVAAHAAGQNPYNSPDVGFIAGHARAIQACLMIADLPPAAAVLDMGCGWGLSSEMMAFAGTRVTAVDINPLFVDLVRRRAARLGLPIEAVESNFDDFDDDREYDLVFFYECLHHSLRPWATLERLARRVKPGGKIMWAGEPMNREWWDSWGLRLHPDAVYCIRKFGWWESGWSAEFITECFARCGFALTIIPDVGWKGTAVGFGVRRETAGGVRPDLSIRVAHGSAEVERLRGELAAMRSSRSWRLTAPVRAATRLSQRLLSRR